MGGSGWFDGIGQLIGSWWQSFGLKAQHDLWLTAGWVMLVIWVWLCYRLLRRLAGHRKFGGRWYNETEYRRLIEVLAEDQKAGQRVMSHEELRALREYKYGNSMKPILSRKGGGYFDV